MMVLFFASLNSTLMVYKIHERNPASLHNRIKKLLVSYDWSDCSFFISGKTFRAHKLIMGISSPVFEAMFYGPLSTNDNIEITDIEPEIFQLLLDYIYTDSVEISSIEDAFNLLYASKKYLLDNLSSLCILYVQQNISIDNVNFILNYPEFMNDTKLISCARELFCEHAQYLLLKYRNQISLPCLKLLVSSNEINMSEVKLIKYVFEWIDLYCIQNCIDNTFENKRDILIRSNLFKNLRVLTLPLSELNEIFKDENNLFLPSEISAIKAVLLDPIKVENSIAEYLNTTFIRRNPLKVRWQYCHRRPLKSVAPIVIDSNNHVVQTRVRSNRSIFIMSVCVPSRIAPIIHFHNNATTMYSEQILVSITCESDNSDSVFTNFMDTVEYNTIIDVSLSEQYFMSKNKWYNIKFVWPNNTHSSCSYAAECSENIYNDSKITFDFEDLSSNAVRNGSFLRGLKFCL